MKSYNVKSNAKRFARGLAANNPAIEPAEPVEVEDGAREWWPAVKVVSKISDDQIRELSHTACVIVPLDPADGVDVTERMGSHHHGPAFDTANADGEIVHHVVKPTPPTRPVPGKDEPTKPAPVIKGTPKLTASGRAQLAAAGIDLSDLPPPVTSTPDEIAARRAERRARIASGHYAEPAKPTKVRKTTKAEIILNLTGRDGGASVPELLDATGWQQHTLRGYIAGTLRKRLKAIDRDIVVQRATAEEPARYIVKPL